MVLNDAFGFEADVLFHRMGYTGLVDFFDAASGPFHNSSIDVKGDSWDVPLLAKYRLGHRSRPYVAAGGVIRLVGPVRGRGEQTDGSYYDLNGTTITPFNTNSPSELRKRFYPGLTAAGGLEFRAARFLLLPELRYTRWTANIAQPGGLLRFPSNQVEFLVGLLF